MKFLEELNERQKEAAQHKDGPLLVVAGAGSGKTKALTFRIAALLAQGVSPHQILAVTFTNKAAQEMKERVQKLLEKEFPHENFQIPIIGTFHSIGVRILRREMGVLHRETDFTIFDSADTLSLAKRLLKEFNIVSSELAPKTLLAIISSFKNTMQTPEIAEKNAVSWRDKKVVELFKLYESEKKKNNALDFDDLIVLPVDIFQRSHETLKKYQNLWKYVLIDEYQDTNGVQYEFARMLTENHRNICAIGDSDQSIYRFRGADLSNILNFQKEYLDAKVVKLEQNYRSTKTILEAADGVIAKNSSRIPKKMFTENEDGESVCVSEWSDEREEAEMVIREIEKRMRDGFSAKDFAILYRTNAQSRALEEAALRHALPYLIVGGLKFYARAEVKDILAYLRFVLNVDDEVSLERIINIPARKIGDTTMMRLKNFANAKHTTTGKILEHVFSAEGISPAAKNAILQFSAIVSKFREMRKKLKLSELVEKILEDSGYRSMLESEGEEGQVRLENVRELISVAKKYDAQDAENALPLFLEEVALVADADESEVKQEKISFMTLHSAKGLEFPIVFLVGCEENIFPSSRAMFSPDDLEEERRLMYVGITRARKKILVSFARTRLLYGDILANKPSRFVHEIPEHLCEGNFFNQKFSAKHFSAGFTGDFGMEKEETKFSLFDIGDLVEHPKFGLGKISNIQGDILTIFFQEIGEKRLAGSIAPLSKRDADFV